jgi:hypothetical protein
MGLLEKLGLAQPKLVTAAATAVPTAARGAGPAPQDAGEPDAAGGPAAKKVDKNAEAYETARAAAQKLIDELGKHPQAGKIGAQIAAAKGHLATAKGHADKAEFDAAKKSVEEARKACVAAKALADKHDAFVKKRASAAAAIAALRRKGQTQDNLDAADAKLTAADAKLAAATPDFAGAMSLVDAALKDVAGTIKQWYVTEGKAQLKKLEASAGKAYIAAEIQQIKDLQAQVEAAVAKGDWSQAVMSGKLMDRIASPSAKLADRRAAFDVQKKKTVAALATLQKNPDAKAAHAELLKRSQAAEALAARDLVQIETGLADLQKIEQDCALAGKAATTGKAYATERGTADTQLAALEKHAAAAQIGEALTAIRQHLAEAATAATAAATPGPAAQQQWDAARAAVARASADLAVAKKLADGMGPAVAAQAAAAKPDDVAGLKKAIAALRKDADAARKAPNAKLAETEFAACTAASTQADADAAKGDGAAAAASLRNASDALIAARAIQAEHGQYADTHKAVSARVKALKALPVAKAIAAKIDAVTQALADADKEDAAHEGAKAMAAVRAAASAATAAEQAAKDRKAYDDRLAAVAKLIKGIADKTVQGQMQALAEAATAKADGFDFAGAEAALKALEVRMAGDKAKALAGAAAPDEKALLAAAKEMVAKGGAKELDALIAGLPAGSTDMKALNALAKGRFGVEFTAGADGEVASMQQVCVMFAKVPEHVVKNPSLKKVHHEKPGKNSGAYGSDGGRVTMNGRPGQSYQQFGVNLLNAQGKSQLPGDVEDACQPKNNDPIDYMDFAALHEVGHSVDDANTFMAQRGDKPEFGGWKRYGGNVQPIADAVAKDCGFDKTPEQKKYVLDKILRLNPTPPTPPAGEDWTAAQDKVDQWHTKATAQNVWWRQSDCDDITIGGLIYHEAYDQDWVSYLATARKKGLTGYQFRAPGEWFAELYAAYRSGKLKDNHPSVAWLSKLKTG